MQRGGIRQGRGDGEDMEDARRAMKSRGTGSTMARFLRIRVAACSQV
jgi:hypothetical protein